MESTCRPSRLFRGRGQSTIEYLLVLLAIALAVGAAATIWIRPAVDQMLAESSQVIRDSATKVKVKLGL
jgi:hypothetical protein